MRATPEWMKENYDRFNNELFNGKLGDCHFEIFTTGRGSQGRVLGKLRLRNDNLYVERYNGAMYWNSYAGRKYIDKNNFVDICMPSIMLNGHYSATEEALQATLVHEMCHYCDYMYGRCPKQAHGPSFRDIASVVSSRSNGRFTIQRLASAEEMSNYQLDADMQAKMDKRVANKKARALAIFVYKADGNIEMTLVSNTNERVATEIYNYYKRKGGVNEIITSSDPELIEMLYQKGYRKLFRVWKYWNVEGRPWSDDIKKYDYNYILKPGEIEESKTNIQNIVESIVDEYVNNMDSEDVKVGGIDLELRSPLEDAE